MIILRKSEAFVLSILIYSNSLSGSIIKKLGFSCLIAGSVEFSSRGLINDKSLVFIPLALVLAI